MQKKSYYTMRKLSFKEQTNGERLYLVFLEYMRFMKKMKKLFHSYILEKLEI